MHLVIRVSSSFGVLFYVEDAYRKHQRPATNGDIRKFFFEEGKWLLRLFIWKFSEVNDSVHFPWLEHNSPEHLKYCDITADSTGITSGLLEAKHIIKRHIDMFEENYNKVDLSDLKKILPAESVGHPLLPFESHFPEAATSDVYFNRWYRLSLSHKGLFVEDTEEPSGHLFMSEKTPEKTKVILRAAVATYIAERILEELCNEDKFDWVGEDQDDQVFDIAEIPGMKDGTWLHSTSAWATHVDGCEDITPSSLIDSLEIFGESEESMSNNTEKGTEFRRLCTDAIDKINEAYPNFEEDTEAKRQKVE